MKTAEQTLEYYNVPVTQNAVDALAFYASQFKTEWVSVEDRLPYDDGYIWARCNLSGNDERVWFDPELSQSFRNAYSKWCYLPK